MEASNHRLPLACYLVEGEQVSLASEMELILDFDPERVALLEASLRFL